MKTKSLILFVIAIMACSSSTFAQMDTTIKAGKVTISKIYAGMLVGGGFSLDSSDVNGFANARFGAEGTYKFTSWASFRGWGMIHIDSQSVKTTSQFWLKLQPIKGFSLEIGKMPTLPSEQRPHQLSGDGHFETGTQYQIPGVAPNAKMKFQSTDTNLVLGAGVALRNKLPEYSGMVKLYKKVELAGWYSKYDSAWGSAMTVSLGRVFNVITWKQDQVIYDFIAVKISKKEDISILSDMGYDFKTKEMVRGEYGFIKGYSSKWLKGLWGLTYDVVTGRVNGYFFTHL